MGLMDFFKANENIQLKERIAQLEATLTPEQTQTVDMQSQILELNKIIDEKQKHVQELEKSIDKCESKIKSLEADIQRKKAASLSIEDDFKYQQFGLYRPRYNMVHSDEYKAKLDEIRNRQKEMIKNNTAIIGNTNWTVSGSTTKGTKMVKDMQKLLLRAFNSECDGLVDKVKYNNFEVSLRRINASCDAISKLGNVMGISISQAYKYAKICELTLAFEYAQKKQEEKEAEKEARARLKEEAKLQKEIEEARKSLEKEYNHYTNALAKINTQLSADPSSQELLAKKAEIESKIADTNKAIQDVDYREANKRAGYVYVISNIGAFGENIYKIGMTRRLNPQERVDELGDASVPFTFDVHAMIFTDDAPKLESALHKAFESKKVNMVNPRREFFNVTLDEIKQVVRQNYDKTVEFYDYPEAEQYRISLKMKS